jgi:type IV secretory pathway VirD2 relaxase
MGKASFTNPESAPALARPASAPDALRGDRSMRIDRPDAERLEGKPQRKAPRKGASGSKAKLSSLLDRRLKTRTNIGMGLSHFSGDRRQQAVVKLHYHNHAGGGGGGLASHLAYVDREATARDDDRLAADRAETVERHTDYLTREGERGRVLFYTADQEKVDARDLTAAWAAGDKRHFRIVLSAEEGVRLQDLPSYAREVMARAETALGKPLAWVAIDHWDTDNPHTHIILRGRDRLGRDLILPKDFVRHGLRSIARDIATERLGERTPTQAREALQRETRAHRLTRLDRLIADQMPKDGVVKVSALQAPNKDPDLTKALKARAQELERLGLAKPVRRHVLAFAPNWEARLKAMELHLDLAKRMAQERQMKAAERALGLAKGGDKGR